MTPQLPTLVATPIGVFSDNGASASAWGLIPSFLDIFNEEKTAKEQINDHYQGGWFPQKGFTATEDDDGTLLSLQYGDPEDEYADPPMKPFSVLKFRDEILYMFDYAYVAIKYDGEWEVCRLD